MSHVTLTDSFQSQYYQQKLKNNTNNSENQQPKAPDLEAQPNMLMAAKCPSPKHVKKVINKIDDWAVEYTKRPHKYDIDKMKDNANFVIDLITDSSNSKSDKGQGNKINGYA